jgi:hypothetical protein
MMRVIRGKPLRVDCATAFYSGAVGADALIWFAVLAGCCAMATALLLHGAVVAVTGALIFLFKRERGDLTLGGIGLPALLLTGPIGGLGSLIMNWAVIRAPKADNLLDAWYRRLSGHGPADAASDLHEKLSAGRAMRPGATEVRRFTTVMHNGSLKEQQSLLGLIGLNYYPEYRSALEIGLVSPETSVRVQAAAVFAKLRERNKLALKECLAVAADEDLDSNRACETGSALRQAIESGFLDPAEMRRARRAALAIGKAMLSAVSGASEIDGLALWLCDAGNSRQAAERDEDMPNGTTQNDFAPMSEKSSGLPAGDADSAVPASFARIHPLPARLPCSTKQTG